MGENLEWVTTITFVFFSLLFCVQSPKTEIDRFLVFYLYEVLLLSNWRWQSHVDRMTSLILDLKVSDLFKSTWVSDFVIERLLSINTTDAWFWRWLRFYVWQVRDETAISKKTRRELESHSRLLLDESILHKLLCTTLFRILWRVWEAWHNFLNAVL